MPGIEVVADIRAFIADPAGDVEEIAHKVSRLEAILHQARWDGIIEDFKIEEVRDAEGAGE